MCHYIKIWEKHAFLNFLLRFHSNLVGNKVKLIAWHISLIFTFNLQIKNRKGFVFSAISLLTFDWERERIQKEEVQEYFDEFDKIQGLQDETIVCEKCNKRKLITNKVAGIEYCDKKCTGGAPKKVDGWEPYLERKNMITWRREQNDGHYAYKVYVSYNDITAEDFLLVQTDVEYRKIWDETAIKLEIVDQDQGKGSNSQIVYWEMLWPKLFANRDYVYNRRTFVDRNRKIILIVNQSTTHPSCPQHPENHRVEEYWSYMVIKPKTTFKQPGLEFILTYFDNPGVRIPKSITNWVAQRQMPDFLDKLHLATLDYAANKKSVVIKTPVSIFFLNKIRNPKLIDNFFLVSSPVRTDSRSWL